MAFFYQQGKCAANLHSDDLDVDAPAELLNLDYGKMSVGRSVQKMRHGAFSRSKNKGYLDAAIAKSNEFWPSRMYIAPYSASTGNMWAENYTMKQYQTGGRQTSLAGRSGMLKMQPLVARKMDRRQLERSQYKIDETTMIGDRFVPPLKPVCKRDFGPDPYEVGRGDLWHIRSVGLGRDASLWQTNSLTRRDSSLVRPPAMKVAMTSSL